MEICDIIWLISNGFELKEKISSGCSEPETKTIIDELFKYVGMAGIEFYEKNSNPEKKIRNHSFTHINENFGCSFRSSPHDFKMLICYIIDTMLLNYNSLGNSTDYPNYSNNTNKLMRLDLFPGPYICGYKKFLYLYKLKIICTEKLNYCEWSSLLTKLNLIIQRCETNAKTSKNISFDSSFNGFLISKFEKILLGNEKPPKIFNILQNKLVFGSFSSFSIFLKGINLLKTPEMKKLGEQYLIKSISIQSLMNMNNKSFKIMNYKTNNLQINQLFQIYCIISMSIHSNDFRKSTKYTIYAEKLLKNLSKTVDIGTRILIKIYILISKLYLLMRNVNAKDGKFGLSNSKFNQFDCLPYLIISNLDLINSEILENAKFLTNEEKNNVLNHLSEYINYLQSDYPALLLSMKLVESCSSEEPLNTRYLYLNADKYQKKSLNTLFPICNIFSYLNEEENNIKNDFLDVHSIICWTKLIPNFLLSYSEVNSIYYENIYNNIFLSQLADQLLHYVQIICSSNSEYARVFPKVKVAELYLFISLYSYFAKDETSKVSEFVLIGSEILESCGESLNVCSIKCIFAYINLLIHLRSSNDVLNIESQLKTIIRNGKMAFKCTCSDQKGLQFKKKMVNLALIQAFTLLSLIKNDFNALGNEELKLHLQFEEIEVEKTDEYYMEGNIIISKYLSITKLLNNCI
ncbi:uncharacterized protein cubi_02981 [Cryptosporidium ubiquitum]|uniref:Uncharacterized protein n=1 Tax=Cryptosporidium ubiquitum TaxID=857276 RepID=A0A1J4MKT9_9CRYT|nr:uncharacterized protein cubi_02981 [Cryptosporidium ubiquitum]OII74849.1 hypothetical protein cubi_02981 [Cryptosporidium ubiquitum]